MSALVKFFSTICGSRNKKSDVDPNSTVGDLIGSFAANPTQHPELNKISVNLKNVIAFVNPKSGGQKGKVVYERLKNYMEKDHIFDLTKGGPKHGLEMYKNVKDLKIIACGGDGTAGWVLSVLDDFKFESPPTVAILPLGTGNDLARTLNWGGGYNNEPIIDFLNKVISGSTVQLDRWTVKTSITDSYTKSHSPKSTSDLHEADKLPLNVINNYFSIGADAKIALDFHKAREKNPAAFSSQAVNKIEYAKKYGKDLFLQSCKNITDFIKIFECDGVDFIDVIKESNCHSIVFLNIPSYAGGTRPYKFPAEQSYSDKKLEVIGFHTRDFMFLQIGGHGDKICQANKIRIVTTEKIPMQVDGEPVLLNPSEILIDFKNQALMVLASNDISVSCDC